jgi:hypothetical protein
MNRRDFFAGVAALAITPPALDIIEHKAVLVTRPHSVTVRLMNGEDFLDLPPREVTLGAVEDRPSGSVFWRFLSSPKWEATNNEPLALKTDGIEVELHGPGVDGLKFRRRYIHGHQMSLTLLPTETLTIDMGGLELC